MNLDGWLQQTITVASITGRGTSGDPTYGTPATLPARVSSASHLKLDTAEGNVVQAQYVVATTTALNINDRVWLPGDNTSSTSAARRPLMIKNAPTKDQSFTLYQTYFE